MTNKFKNKKRGKIIVEKPKRNIQSFNIEESNINFSINRNNIIAFILSLFTLGPAITCAILLCIGFFRKYNKWMSCGILLSCMYGLLGYVGILLFLSISMFTIYSLFCDFDTSSKISELDKNNEISKQIKDINDSTINKYDDVRNYIIDIVDKSNNFVKKRYPRQYLFISNSVFKGINISVTIFNNLIDDCIVIHKLLYNSKYDIYVCISDKVYDVYKIIKLCSFLFTANNLLGLMNLNIDEMANMNDLSSIEDDLSQKMLTDINKMMEQMMSGGGQKLANNNAFEQMFKLF